MRTFEAAPVTADPRANPAWNVLELEGIGFYLKMGLVQKYNFYLSKALFGLRNSPEIL